MTERLRGRPWRRIRDRILKRDQYLCQICLKAGIYRAADEVDHVRALAHGGTDDDDQLQSVCVPCHREKTAREFGHRERREVGLDGWLVTPGGWSARKGRPKRTPPTDINSHAA